MTTPAHTKVPPPNAAGASAETVRLSALPTPASLPRLPGHPTAGAGSRGRSAPALERAYSLLLPSKSGAVFLQHGRSRVLPLFTGPDEVKTFLVSARLTRCWIIELPTAEAVADFLHSPPDTFGAAAGFLVAIDPADLVKLASGLFTAREVIDALAEARPGG